MLRTFIAIDLDAKAHDYLLSEIQKLKRTLPNIRWVNSTQFHLTLVFLGATEDSLIPEILDGLQQICSQLTPLHLQLANPGTFGNPLSPRVVWHGIGGRDLPRLQELQISLSSFIRQLGFKLDERAFSPHITLARIKHHLKGDESVKLAQIIAAGQIPDHSAKPIHVKEVILYKSELSPSEAKYTPLGKAMLSK